MGIETYMENRGKISSVSRVTPAPTPSVAETGGINGGAPVPESERFVAAFDALFPQGQVLFFEWADSSWFGTLGMLRYAFRTSRDGFQIPTAELIGGLLRAGYRLDPRDNYGRKMEDPRRALHEGQWSSGPWGT